MSSPKYQRAARAASHTRVVLASFAAGVGSMLAAGLLAPVLMKGGLSLADADAATAAAKAPVIEPLDIEAVQAQLQDADRVMRVSRTRTGQAMDRLEHLSGG
jgi:hypothetical protein